MNQAPNERDQLTEENKRGMSSSLEEGEIGNIKDDLDIVDLDLNMLNETASMQILFCKLSNQLITFMSILAILGQIALGYFLIRILTKVIMKRDENYFYYVNPGIDFNLLIISILVLVFCMVCAMMILCATCSNGFCKYTNSFRVVLGVSLTFKIFLFVGITIDNFVAWKNFLDYLLPLLDFVIYLSFGIFTCTFYRRLNRNEETPSNQRASRNASIYIRAISEVKKRGGSVVVPREIAWNINDSDIQMFIDKQEEFAADITDEEKQNV